MLNNWFKIYVYRLIKNKLFFIWNTLGLAIGIAVVVLAVMHWQDELSYNAWNPERLRIYEFYSQDSLGVYLSSADGLGPDLLKQQKFIDDYCYFAFEYVEFYGESEHATGLVEKIINTQNSFFNFYPFEFIYGSAATVFDQELQIAISESVAQQFFGNQNPLGQTLVLAHQPFVIGGVYRMQGKSSIMPNVVLPNIESNVEQTTNSWSNANYGLLLKLKDERKPELLFDEVERLYWENSYSYHAKERNISLEAFKEMYVKNLSFKMTSMSDSRLHTHLVESLGGKGKAQFMYLILSCSLLVLVLSVVNYVNLNHAYAVQRLNELALREVVGASRSQIAMQLIFETVLNVSVAVLLSLVFVELILPLFNDLVNKELTLSLGNYWYTILGISGLVVFFGGYLPSLYSSKINYSLVLKGNFKYDKSRWLWSNFLLIFQFSIAFFFLVGGLVMALQIRFLENKDLGFQSGDLVQIKLFNQQNRRKFYENAENIEKIKHITGVEGAALSSISFRNKIEPRVDVSVEQRSFGADAVGVTDDYLRLLKFKMTAISIQDSTPQVVVNKRFVSESGITDILGKEVSIGGRCYLVRAVVEDFLKAGFGELPEPLVLFSLTEHSFLPYHIEWVTLKVKPENRQATLALLENFWKANIDSEYPFQAVPLADLYAENYESFAKQRNMFWVFNLAVVFISLFGLFALVSFDVERRLKEMAVRKVLGASNLSLLRQLGFRFIMYAGVGALLAIYPSHLIMTAWLANFKYHIPWSIAPFAFAFVTLFILTFCVVLFRVYQVTRMDLLKFLKYE